MSNFFKDKPEDDAAPAPEAAPEAAPAPEQAPEEAPAPAPNKGY
jgi:hypothetical protein